MRGTTVCPHCNTRFKITKAQLEAHHGMVRCGNCQKAFDTGPNFAPDQLDLQLELPILDKPVHSRESRRGDTQPMTLAEKVVIVKDADLESRNRPRSWPWIVASVLALLVLTAQATYDFRIDLAAQMPAMKPALVTFCRLLNCTVPLPQHPDLISIESSGLESDPSNASQITLTALLRNRAPYAQAFPNLELTLNDKDDEPVARRTFTPDNYLPQTSNETTGLLPNHELGISLRLGTGNLHPFGYRLVLLYPEG